MRFGSVDDFFFKDLGGCVMRWVGERRDNRCTLTLALRNGPITRVTGLTGFRMLAKSRRALLG